MNSHANSLCELLEQVVQQNPEQTVEFYTEGVSVSYRDLWSNALSIASGLVERKVQPREPIGIVASTHPMFLPSLLGILMSGGAAVPMPAGGARRVIERIQRIVTDAEIRIVVTPSDDEAESLASSGLETMSSGALRSIGREDGSRAPSFRDLEPDHLALIQYTSGSTSAPRGVMITHGNLLAGVWAIADRGEITPTEVGFMWLPLHHDMGLISLLADLAGGARVVLWPAEAFIRRPVEWLRCFSEQRGTLSTGPNFSYDRILAKLAAEEVGDLDLSAWRMAFNGSETVQLDTIHRFHDTLARFGLRSPVMAPSYGLAEATLAVTLLRSGEQVTARCVDRKRLTEDGAVVEVSPDTPSARDVVCLGSPVVGHEVRIVGPDGSVMPDLRVGEIEVRGPAVSPGYYDPRNPTGSISSAGARWLKTGDLGFLAPEGLYMTGRLKELFVLRGRNIYAEDIESVAVRSVGIPQAFCGACVIADGDEERVRVCVEVRDMDEDQRSQLRAAIRERILEELGVAEVDVRVLERGQLPRTTSGKIQRYALRHL